jgi:hypothetical protein
MSRIPNKVKTTPATYMLGLETVTTIPTWEHEKEMDRGDEFHHSVTQKLKSLVMRHLIMKNNIFTDIKQKVVCFKQCYLYNINI